MCRLGACFICTGVAGRGLVSRKCWTIVALFFFQTTVRLFFITPFHAKVHATAGNRVSGFVFVNPGSASLTVDVTENNQKMEEVG